MKLYKINKLVIKNNCFLIYCDRKILNILYKQFSYADNSKCFVNGRYIKSRIKYLSSLSIINNNGKLPIGFLSEFLHVCDEKNFRISEKCDNRKIQSFSFKREEIKNSLGYLSLYDYQIKAIKKCLRYKIGIIMLQEEKQELIGKIVGLLQNPLYEDEFCVQDKFTEIPISWDKSPASISITWKSRHEEAYNCLYTTQDQISKLYSMLLELEKELI